MFDPIPLRFDAERLRAEAHQFGDGDWWSHASEAAGNASISLVSVGGASNRDFAIAGPMAPTVQLLRCPYLRQVLRSFEAPLSRCRLLRLPAEAPAFAEVDYTYNGFRRRLIYMPIVANGAVHAYCDGYGARLPEGTAWTFDRSKRHFLVNEGKEACITLLIETKGSRALDSQLRSGWLSCGEGRGVPYGPDSAEPIPTETYAFEVLTPSEVDGLAATILEAVKSEPTVPFSAFAQALEAWCCSWKAQFAHHGHLRSGELGYQDLVLDFDEHIALDLAPHLPAESPGRRALEIIRSVLLTGPGSKKHHRPRVDLSRLRRHHPARLNREEFRCPEFEKPLVIVSTPRSGSTLLFETLVHCPGIWTIGGESHAVIEDMPALHPAAHDYHSNRLTAADASPDIAHTLRERLARRLRDRTGRFYLAVPPGDRPNPVRFLEKTPKNALRIPFLRAVFPDARFVYLYREPKDTISSMVEAWRERAFVAYRSLPGWPYRDWSFLLVPGWQSLRDRSLIEIATYQWQSAHEHILADLREVPRAFWHRVNYTELLREPQRVVRDIAEFAELSWDAHMDQVLSAALPHSSRTLSAPAADKWRRYAPELASALPDVPPNP